MYRKGWRWQTRRSERDFGVSVAAGVKAVKLEEVTVEYRRRERWSDYLSRT